MASRTIKTHPGHGTVDRMKVQAAVIAVRAGSKPRKHAARKARPIKNDQTASGRNLISFRVESTE